MAPRPQDAPVDPAAPPAQQSTASVGIGATASYSVAATSAAPLGEGSTLGPYRVLAKLGEGGMGAVFKAVHSKLDKVVALKVLPQHLTRQSQLVARFEREMKAVGKLEHPHIVRAMDAGEIDGIHYLAMEFVEGIDLQQLVQAKGPLSVPNACKALRQAALALTAAHAAGLVHRDIKPANLLVAKSGHIKLLDLGLALLGDEVGGQTELTAAGQTFGTPDYMAPEQWEDAHGADGRVDLYALGCTLFYALVGHAPFATDQHRTAVAKMKAHVTATVPNLQAARVDVPDGVAAIYEKLLAKSPGDRYQTAAELVEALAPFATSKSPAASGVLATAAPAEPASPPPVTDGDSPRPNAPPTEASVPFHINTNITLRPTKKSLQKLQTAGDGRGGASRKLLLGVGGGAAALVLLGAIIITITNRDGTKSTVTVPEGIAVDVKAATGSKVEITQADGTMAKPDAANVATADATIPDQLTTSIDLPEVDYMAERQAAEWVLSVGGKLRLQLKDVAEVPVGDGKLPDEPFAIWYVSIVNNPKVRDDDLAHLGRCHRLRELVLIGTSLNGSGLRHLEPIASLTDLVFCFQKDEQGDDKQATDQALAPLANLRGLRHLDIGGNLALTDACLTHVAALNQLQSLTGFFGLTDAGLVQLDSLDKLQALKIGGVAGVTDDGILHFLSKHPRTQETGISNLATKQQRTLAPLADGPELERIWISGDQLTTSSLPVLQQLEKLKTLWIDSPTDEALAQVSRVTQLQELQLFWNYDGAPGLAAASYELLAAHPRLETLTFTQSDGSASPTDENLLTLAKMPRLKTLTLSFGRSWKYTPAGIAKFCELRPDVPLNADGKNYPAAPNARPPAASATPAPAVSIPKPKPVKTAASPTPAGPLLKLKPGTPISPRALVANPATIKDLASWSIELTGHAGLANALDVSPDGTRIATVGGWDDTLRLWRIDEGGGKLTVKFERLLLGDSGQLNDVTWSPDGQTLAVSSFFGKTVALYDADTGRRLRSFTLNGARGGKLAWSPDGRRLAAPHNGLVAMIDPVEGSVLHSQTTGYYCAGAWSPDSREFVTIQNGGLVKFWNPLTLEVLAEVPTNGGVVDYAAVSWSPDGLWVATVGGSGLVTLIDARLRRQTKQVVTDAEQYWVHAAWEPGQAEGATKDPHWPRLLMSAAYVPVWDATLTKPLATCRTEGGRHSSKAVWMPDGRRIVALEADLPAVFDATTGERLSAAERTGQPAGMSTWPDFQISTDGKTLRTVYGNDLLLFNAETGEYLKKYGNMPASRLATAPKDNWLALYDTEDTLGKLFIVDTSTYEQRFPLTGHTAAITGANWSPDSKLLASSSKDGTVRIWKASAVPTQTQLLKHDRPVRNVVWSPDNKRVATCAEDDVIRLWMVDSGKEERKYDSLPSPSAWGPNGIAWSPVGDLIAIAPRDAAARVLDLKTGRFSEPWSTNFQSSMGGVAWSSDAKQVVVANHGELGYRAVNAKESQHVYGHGTPMQWMPDNRRVATGQSGARPIQAVDTRKGARLGILYPKLFNDGWVCIGADGHYRGSEGIESQIVCVALHKDGSQTTHPPAEFQQMFGWKNDPSKATFLKLRDGKPGK